jgi:hypothetical protein
MKQRVVGGEPPDARAARAVDPHLRGARQRGLCDEVARRVEVHPLHAEEVLVKVSLERELVIEDADAVGEVRRAGDDEVVGVPADSQRTASADEDKT